MSVSDKEAIASYEEASGNIVKDGKIFDSGGNYICDYSRPLIDGYMLYSNAIGRRSYQFLAYREQRVYFEVEAKNESEAQELAQKAFENIDFFAQDESDDPGEFELVGESS